MIVLFQISFFLCNLLLGLLFVALYPLIYLLLRWQRYQSALQIPSSIPSVSILIHAASVGEINAVKPLIQLLHKRYPHKQIVITTNTLAGLQTARKIDEKIICRLAPLDFLFLRLKQMKQLKPELICIVETEIWFNLIFSAGFYQIPMIFVNARLSQRSLRRMLWIKPLIQWLEQPIRQICCQSEEHRKRFRKLFSVPVSTCGNLKYAAELPIYDPVQIRQELQYQEDDFILCFGSSRPGEEELIKSIYPSLLSVIPNLKLIIAIRHLKRVEEVEAIFKDYKYSKLSQAQSPAAIHLIDQMGHLNRAYAICDLAIVGGSFYDYGGHNPLEPAFYSKAIIMGKYHHSCLDSIQKLQENDAIVISNPQELLADIIRLYHDEALRKNLGARAKTVLDANAASLKKYFLEISKHLEHSNA